MKRVIASAVITVLLFSCAAVFSFAQEETGKVTLRILPVDWYEISGDGVKVMYRTFNNEPVTLYLPSSFERKFFRFVDTPKEYGGTNSLPFMLVHMRGQEVIYIDIYTRFMRTDARIANYGKEDLENFKAQEKKGNIEVKLF
jgi:hypothetical protein